VASRDHYGASVQSERTGPNASWSDLAVRNAVYQLAALTIGARLAAADA
jgi:hypothetical protein